MDDSTAILVLASNTADFTEQCLASIKKSNIQLPHEVILIDNGSNEDEQEKLLNLKGFDQYIRLSKNKGFAGGFNTGIRRGLQDGHDYFSLVSCDTLVTPDWLANMIKASKTTGAGLVGCLSNYVASLKQQLQVYGGQTPNRYIELDEVDFVTFVDPLITRNTIKKVGYLDEIFFPTNYDDNDYCMRCRINGVKMIIDGYTFIYHAPGSQPTHKVADHARSMQTNKQIFELKWKEELAGGGLLHG